MVDLLPLVVDMGSGDIKAGRSTSQIPEVIVPNVVGRPILRSDESFSREKLKDIMLCDEVIPVRQYLEITMPVENGLVRSWFDEEMVLNYVWEQKLKVNPKDHVVLVTEPALPPTDSRRKVLEYYFEKFGFAGVQLTPQALLVLYAQGLTTGLVVESGDGVTSLLPVYENYLLPHLVAQAPVAGRHVTERLAQLLTLHGYSFHKTSDHAVLDQIKQHLCFVSADIEKDRQIANETTSYCVPYTLPDTRVIKVAGERFEAPECIFQPAQIGLEGVGLSEQIFKAVMNSDINLRKKFFSSIVVSGGNSMFPGFSTRIVNDLKKLILKHVLAGNAKALSEYKVTVEDPPTRQFLVYQGATVLAQLGRGKDNVWAMQKDYKEMGADKLLRARFGGQ